MTKLLADIRIAILNLLRNKRRTLIATLSIAGGVIAFLLAGGFIAWIFKDMREATIHSQLGHIQIVRPGYFDQGIADPYRYLLPTDSKAQKSITGTPGIKTLAPHLAFSGLLSQGDATVPFIGEGVEPEKEHLISTRMTITAGEDLKTSNDRAVLLGEGLAKSVGAKPGEKIVLLATAANGSPNAVELVVAGTFATITKEYDDNTLRVPIAIARKLMRIEGATTWIALLENTEDTDRIASSLKTNLESGRYEVSTWQALAEFYNKTVTLFSKQVNIVKIIIGLIIVLTISNTQTMSVLERTTEIGTSLAIGVRRSEILRIFILEGVLLGLIGGTIGLIVGYILALTISAIGIPMPPPPGMVRGYTGQILIDAKLAFDSLTLAFLTTLLASLAPAWKASKMNIVDALRTNQ